MIVALLVALVIYLPFGIAAVIEERRERAITEFAPGFVPGDHRQWKHWLP